MLYFKTRRCMLGIITAALFFYCNGSAAIKGDVNNDGNVNLGDAIESLKAVSGSQDTFFIQGGVDIGNDEKITVEEAVYGLNALLVPPPTPTELAFPEAKGFGAKATGGRGGRVIKVTNLNGSGPGSLQEALNQNEPRIIIFTVSGVIESTDPIEVPYGNVTIAGQTAPGAGITLKSRFFGAYDTSVQNIIIRHIRVRPHDFDDITGVPDNQYDAMQFSRNRNMIFDHISVGFGVDETFDIYEARDVTVQWSIIQEASTKGESGGTHNYGLINGPDGFRLSLYNNLFVNNRNRNPAITNGPAEVINNVIHNVRHGFVHHNPASGNFNIIGNYYKQGPDNSLHPFFFDDTYNNAKYYLNDNYINDPGDDMNHSVDNPWSDSYFTLDKPVSTRALNKFNFSGTGQYVAYQPVSSTQAYTNVLAQAGVFPRDSVDIRDVSEVLAGTGAWGARIPADLMAGLTPTTTPTDSDNDGMPDTWEVSNSLNPQVADHNTLMASGYTAIEDYINELATALLP